MKLPNLTFKPFMGGNTGVQANYKEWSIVCHAFSYGNKDGLYEVMGPGFDDGSGVEGHLELGKIMKRIARWEEEHAA